MGLRIALLTYRGNPRSGGQGVYVRYLSRALVEDGHHVEVIAGPPYPELDPRVSLVELPSLDLYRADDPFRTPRRHEFHDAIDALEFATMCVAGFPEPLTFSLRAARYLRERSEDFDIVHDNQCLGYGLLAIARRLPLLATVHHPVTIDRRMEIEHASGRSRRLALRRWYAFTRMQRRVARRLPRVLTVSRAAAGDVARELGVMPERIGVVHNGVDTELFRPLAGVERVPGRILTVSSADVPLKGLPYLIEAVAKLRTERVAELVVVGPEPKRGRVRGALDRFAMRDHVTFTGVLDPLHLVDHYARAQVAVVPSLYEGFSLPAVEAMACAIPLVTTTGGALPEVVGRDGQAALHVPPGDAGALAHAIARLLDDDELRAALATAGRERALGHFGWETTARATVAEYERVIERC